jgi:hypothetical protein
VSPASRRIVIRRAQGEQLPTMNELEEQFAARKPVIEPEAHLRKGCASRLATAVTQCIPRIWSASSTYPRPLFQGWVCCGLHPPHPKFFGAAL